MKEYKDFYNKVKNNGYDIDGYYGWQCWDGFAKYCKWLGYPVFNCSSTGYAVDIWNDRKKSGILKYFDEVKPSNLKKGDVIIYKKCTMHPDTHIAIFNGKKGSNQLSSLGQNQSLPSDHPYGMGHSFNTTTDSYDGLVGGLRPKAYQKEPSYYTSKNVTKIKIVKDCYIYKNKKQNKKERVKKVKKGTELDVKDIYVYKDGVSRFKVSGGWITGNSDYVSSAYYLLDKYDRCTTVRIEKSCYLYNDKKFKKKIRKLKKGELVTIVDNVASGNARRLKTYAGNYFTARKEYSKWI